MTSLDEYLCNCQEPTVWEVGNQTLYDLCAKYPAHTDPSQIVAKTWLIGRTYSVALERRRGAFESNEVYYREKIPQVFSSSHLDLWLSQLPEDKELTADLLPDVLAVHTNLVSYLKMNLDSTEAKQGLNRVSFCSKYLHFHRPLLFPIYDARAVKGLRLLIKDYLPEPLWNLPNPATYKPFVEVILNVLPVLASQANERLTLRHFDNLLLLLSETSQAKQRNVFS